MGRTRQDPAEEIPGGREGLEKGEEPGQRQRGKPPGSKTRESRPSSR